MKQPKLVCAKAKAGAGCAYRGIDVGIVEGSLLSNLGSFIGHAPSGVAGLDLELEEAETVIGVYQDEADNLVQSLAQGPSIAITNKLRELERELADFQATRTALVERIATGSSPVLSQRLREVEVALLAEPLDRPRANLLLRSVLASVVIDYPNGILNFHWKHGGESSIQYAMPMN